MVPVCSRPGPSPPASHISTSISISISTSTPWPLQGRRKRKPSLRRGNPLIQGPSRDSKSKGSLSHTQPAETLPNSSHCVASNSKARRVSSAPSSDVGCGSPTRASLLWGPRAVHGPLKRTSSRNVWGIRDRIRIRTHTEARFTPNPLDSSRFPADERSLSLRPKPFCLLCCIYAKEGNLLRSRQRPRLGFSVPAHHSHRNNQLRRACEALQSHVRNPGHSILLDADATWSSLLFFHAPAPPPPVSGRSFKAEVTPTVAGLFLHMYSFRPHQ